MMQISLLFVTARVINVCFLVSLHFVEQTTHTTRWAFSAPLWAIACIAASTAMERTLKVGESYMVLFPLRADYSIGFCGAFHFVGAGIWVWAILGTGTVTNNAWVVTLARTRVSPAGISRTTAWVRCRFHPQAQLMSGTTERAYAFRPLSCRDYIT